MAKSRRAKKQIKEVNPKMGFIWRAKHGFKDQKISLIEKGSKPWRGEERRREEEEEEEKKRRSGDQAKQAKGMELWILYGSHGIVSFI